MPTHFDVYIRTTKFGLVTHADGRRVMAGLLFNMVSFEGGG